MTKKDKEMACGGREVSEKRLLELEKRKEECERGAKRRSYRIGERKRESTSAR